MMNATRRTTMIVLTALAACTTCVHAQNSEAPVTEPGVSIRMYDIGLPMSKQRPLVPGQTPNVSKVIPQLNLDTRRGDFRPLEYYFILHADGYLNIEQPGLYEFELTSDDGSILWINDTKVVDNDFEHSRESKTGKIELAAGLHPFEVHYFNGVGGGELWLKWKPPGSAQFEMVPTSALRAPKGQVRVTSPGQKKIVSPLKRGTPGDGQPLEAVHPSFDLAQARPSWFEPRVGGIDWLSNGTMVLCLWDADGSVYFLNGAEGDDPEQIEVKRFAAGLAEPLGLRVVDDRIFVLQKQELTELIDHDKDGVADEYRCVCSGWDVTANFHEFAFGLVYKDGSFYFNLAIAINPGGASTRPQVHDRGNVVKVSLADGTFELVADGLRTPNGIGFGVDGEIFLTDNQGDWLPVSKVLHFKPGAFYASRAVMEDMTVERPVTQPVVWLPQGEIGNSPGEVTPFNFGPYQNQMIHSDVTHGGLKRVFAEKVDGNYQGVVFRMTQGLEAGINRVRQGPDGALYVGGIGSTGNWGQEGKKKIGLQKLTYNGKTTFEMLAIRAKSNGIEIEFTEPLPDGAGWNADQYYVEQFWYEPTKEYGGPKKDQERLPVKSASVSSDRTRVFLELEGMKPVHVLYVRLLGSWKSASNNPIWSTEAWYTMNAIPKNTPGNVAPPAHQPKHNQLTEAERKAGWQLLFDGSSANGWRGFRQSSMPTQGWTVENGALVCTGGGGDIITDASFSDFELSFEWKVEPGGNSGVFFRVNEDESYVWSTGPEYQLLDNERHRDGENPITSAGANYAVHAPEVDYSYPAGSFNHSKIVVKGNHVEHWMNGEMLFAYDIGSEDWLSRVAGSKFRGMPKYGREASGHIALQDHGDRVAFRNIKIRPIE